MPEKRSVHHAGHNRIALPFGTREPEAVWEVTPHGVPESLSFILTHDFELIIVRLIQVIVTDNVSFVDSLSPIIVCSPAPSSGAGSPSSTLLEISKPTFN